MQKKPLIYILIASVLVLCLGVSIGTYYYVQWKDKQVVLLEPKENKEQTEQVEAAPETVSADKITDIDILDLLYAFSLNEEENSSFPDWKIGTDGMLPIKWIVEKAEMNQTNGQYTKSGSATIKVEDKPVTNWSILMTGTKDNVKILEAWKPNAVDFNVLNIEKIFSDRKFGLKNIKSDGGSALYGRRFYEINIPGKKTSWLDYQWNSGTSGASARLILYLDKVEADNVKYPAEMANGNYTPPAPAPISKPTTIQSGLLLGVRNNSMSIEGRYKTLWLAPKDGYIKLYQGNNFILAPHGDAFWKIDYTRFLRDDNQKFGILQNNNNPTYGADIRYFNPHLAAEAAKPKYLPETYIIPDGYNYEGRFEDLLFVGNKYVCMEQNTAFRGKTGTTNIGYTNLYQIPEIGQNDKRISIESLYGATINTILDKYRIKQDALLSQLKQQAIGNSGSGNDIVFTRDSGKFTAKLKTKYLDQKKELITSGIIDLPDIPDEVTTHNKLGIDWKVLQQRFPDIRDAVTSPDNDMLVILTNNSLKVCQMNHNTVGIEVFSYSISKDTNIIMAQWATKDFVPKWFNEMVRYLK